MNQQFDIIIVGDSKHGNETVKYLATVNTKLKIAFISREFKSSTTHDFLNVEYIKDEVVFTDYRNRLFGCYLKAGDRMYCTHLVIATGLKYAPLILNGEPVPNVFNTAENIDKAAKNQQAIVLGKNDADVKFATAVAKKYKYVYFCTESLSTPIASANLEKLSKIKNLVILPNTSITKVVVPNNALSSVELSNYSTLTCSAIYIKTESTPEVDFISDKLISRDELGYLKTTNNLQSLLVPKCFAIGNCTSKSTQKMKLAMCESILNDFIGGN